MTSTTVNTPAAAPAANAPATPVAPAVSVAAPAPASAPANPAPAANAGNAPASAPAAPVVPPVRASSADRANHARAPEEKWSLPWVIALVAVTSVGLLLVWFFSTQGGDGSSGFPFQEILNERPSPQIEDVKVDGIPLGLDQGVGVGPRQ